jgi:hypothetical protein
MLVDDAVLVHVQIGGPPDVEFGYTGHGFAASPAPSDVGRYARDTRRVYEELLGSAERSIWASTYAFFDGPRAFEVLARRMDSMPALHVTLQRQRATPRLRNS